MLRKPGNSEFLSPLRETVSYSTLLFSQNEVQFASGFDGNLADIDGNVSLRYAGDDFLKNIQSSSDLDNYFLDASSIPVRLDGRGNTSFVKLSFDKQQRHYTVSSVASSARNLAHNDLIGVCLNGNWSSSCRDYLLRVVRYAPDDDLSANLALELQVAALNGQPIDDPKSIIGSGVGSNYPALYESGSSSASEFIYDADFDGLPWVFDPNDEDPNIPGTPSIGEEALGLSISLRNDYEYSDFEEALRVPIKLT